MTDFCLIQRLNIQGPGCKNLKILLKNAHDKLNVLAYSETQHLGTCVYLQQLALPHRMTSKPAQQTVQYDW